MYNAITDVTGLKVGHYTDKEAVTGCTVILCETGAVAGVDVRGSAPGTRETDLLRPMNLVEKVHAVLLSGGSAFGLDAAGGVMRYLEERGFGHETMVAKVPIVPAAIIFDLNLGSSNIRPGIEQGYKACLAATEKEVAEGCVGAGTGATVGKILGIERATKSGLGTASCKIGLESYELNLKGGIQVSRIEPVEKRWIVNMSLDEARSALVKALELLKGRAVTSSGPYIKYDFGSLLRSRLLGEWWVSRETLPKRAEIYLERINEFQTEVNLLIRETHKYAFKWGFVDKYKRALQEIADAIQGSVQ